MAQQPSFLTAKPSGLSDVECSGARSLHCGGSGLWFSFCLHLATSRKGGPSSYMTAKEAFSELCPPAPNPHT